MDRTKKFWVGAKTLCEEIIRFFCKNKLIASTGALAIVYSILYMKQRHMIVCPNAKLYCLWLNDISISYAAAVIFYIVDVYIKERINEKKCVLCLKNDFAGITKDIDLAKLLYVEHVRIKDKGADLSWNGKGENGEKKIYFRYSHVDGNVSMRKSLTEAEIFQLKDKFKGKVEKIRNNPIIKFCDYELLELLTKIEEIDLFGNIETLILSANTELDLHYLDGVFDKIEALNKRIKEICGIEWAYKLEEVGGADLIFADFPRRNLFEELQNIDEFNKKNIKLCIKKQFDEKGEKITERNVDSLAEAIYQDLKNDKGKNNKGKNNKGKNNKGKNNKRKNNKKKKCKRKNKR